VRSIVVDTGPLVALFKRRDRDHARVHRFLRENPCSLITTWPVVTEVWHMLGEPAKLPFARWIVAGGAAVFDLRAEDQSAMLGLLEKYHDRPMDVADASLVLLSDRMGLEEILTIDRSDFDVYRLKGGKRFVQVLAMAGL
jgi:predicted nucleic acid-binding protein